MSDPRSVETRLAAMERRLAEIQEELAPDAPSPSVPEPEPAAPPEPAASAPEPARSAPGPAQSAPEPDPAPPRPAAVEVSAGPFPSMGALREFERAVAALPGVREVSVRGYESGNRAILEVQLSPETS